MRWMLLLVFVVTVPAFVWLVARWPRRDDGPDPEGPRRPPRAGSRRSPAEPAPGHRAPGRRRQRDAARV